MRKLLIAVATVVAVACHAQYRPLEVADSCDCGPNEYCRVTPGRVACEPLPAACGAHPTCACVGDRIDACRDYDGRLTLLPPRPVATCDACAPEELCIDAGRPACRVAPPDCDERPTCDCVLHGSAAGKYACDEHRGHVVLRNRLDTSGMPDGPRRF